MDSVKILVIDDAPEDYRKVTQLFGQVGAEVLFATSRQQALRQFYEWRPDLVLLDISTAQPEDWEVCRLLSSISNSPVIVVSSLRDNDVAVRAQEMGARDYLAKPFNPEIVLAKSKAALRKMTNNYFRRKSISYQDNYIGIDLGRRWVTVDGESVHLTKTEYRLLAYLLHNAGQVLSMNQILQSVWGSSYQEKRASVHVYISRLRHKLERDPRRPRYLLTEYGVGYRFESRKNMAAQTNKEWVLDV